MLVEITDLQTADVTQTSAIANNTIQIANSTHESTHDTLVKRNNTGTTQFHDITTNILSVNDGVAIYGDGTLQFVPTDDNDDPVVGYKYRFGSNAEELPDTTLQGDGLEFRDPTGNDILVQVNQQTPTIELQVNKNADVPFLLVRNTASDKLVQLDAHGVSQRYDVFSMTQLTPGTLLQTTALEHGPQVHRFELFSAWTEQVAETIIEISASDLQSTTEHRVIENLDVCLDDLSVVSGVADIHSRLCVKRWGQYRNVVQRLYIVIGCDFHNNEIQLDASSQIRISFNNKLVL
jgi:hypothetical protein